MEKIEIPPIFSDRWFTFWEEQHKKTGNKGKVKCEISRKGGKNHVQCYLIT